MSFRQPSTVAIGRARASLEASRVPDTHPAVPLLSVTWQQIAAVCADLTDTQWLTATACPGWTVLDQLSHIIGSERTLLGHPMPRDPVMANHVTNELGGFNEAWVENYRGWRGAELMMEFSRISQERLEVLRRLSDGDLDAEVITPLGLLPLGEFLYMRVFDCFIHEQDIRHAVGRPGDLDSEAAAFAVERSLAAMPKVVARAAHAPNGTTVVFSVEGDAGAERAVVVADGRGHLADQVPEHPTVHLDFDTDTFLRLSTGRISGEAALAAALVGVDGDVALGRTILGAMNFMF